MYVPCTILDSLLGDVAALLEGTGGGVYWNEGLHFILLLHPFLKSLNGKNSTIGWANTLA